MILTGAENPSGISVCFHSMFSFAPLITFSIPAYDSLFTILDTGTLDLVSKYSVTNM